MDLQRVRREVTNAQTTFPNVECHPTSNGGLFVLAALQPRTQIYTLRILFPDTYPNVMPSVYVSKPAIKTTAPHRYKDGNLCYLHPRMWNPGLHSLTFVIGRTAKWLAKYEVWQSTGSWPGAELPH
jgi:hypothetical protein